MTAEEAEAYHATQIGTFAETGADLVTAITMTYADEAIGVVRAARAAGLPVVISFTVETDGRLPSGQSLREAIEEVDARTDAAAAYFMVNCAHPSHFYDVLEPGAPWTDRIRGVRANASRLSHAELDEAEELDEGDPEELANEYVALRERLPRLTVLGGCCGTDHRHVEAMSKAWLGDWLSRRCPTSKSDTFAAQANPATKSDTSRKQTRFGCLASANTCSVVETSVEIRHAEPADYGRVIGRINAWWGGRDMAPMLPRLFFVHFEGTSYVVDDEDGQLAAFLIGFLSQTNDEEAYIHFVGVAPEHRGAGLGRRLYERFFDDVARRAARPCAASPRR